MADPRYRPRDFCIPPELFGKAIVSQSIWRPPPIPDIDDLRPAERERRLTEQLVFMHAAQIQHAHAYTIRYLMKGKELTLADYAKLTGRESGKRIGACLRGEVVMRFDDLAWAEHILGKVGEILHRDQIVERRRQAGLEYQIRDRADRERATSDTRLPQHSTTRA